jgi:hypothetical protein
MPRIEPVDPNDAPEEVAQPLEQARQLGGQSTFTARSPTPGRPFGVTWP